MSRTSGSRRTALRASAAMRYAKFGAHCGVGSRNRTSTSPSAETSQEVTNLSDVIGSSSSGS
jgi:hypothetical protein